MVIRFANHSSAVANGLVQDTMNMNPILLGNIRTNAYFQRLSEKKTFEELVDQVRCSLISSNR